MPEITVWVTLQFPMFHWWEGAPPSVHFLKSNHRHIFHVKAWKKVNHDDRDIEFITLKEEMEKYVELHFENNSLRLSCEMIAMKLINSFGLCKCSVSEDGENGAEVSV
jgi:hypothetical protein